MSRLLAHVYLVACGDERFVRLQALSSVAKQAACMRGTFHCQHELLLQDVQFLRGSVFF